jgi:hypothetical protein
VLLEVLEHLLFERIRIFTLYKNSNVLLLIVKGSEVAVEVKVSFK